ncbi:MAG: TRAP transporter large permease [Granulosicoccus sp.]|nr:TRAP transporter large permease [Granulosicoccus sp.]
MTAQLLLLLAVFLGTMALRFPVILCITLSTVAYALVYPVMPPVVVVQTLLMGLDRPVFAAIPYYFLLGAIMNAGGMSRRLLRLANALLGWCRGGLAHVNIGASMLFGGISGSAVADASAIGSIMIPAMQKEGYPGAYAAAVTSCSACIGLLIPPSIPLVVFGLFNNVSVADLFLAGVLPGLLMGVYLMLTSILIARRRGYAAHPWKGFAEVKAAIRGSALALLLPVLITFCMVKGVATVSEIGAIAVVYSIVVSLMVYRDVDLNTLGSTIVSSALDSAKVMSIIAVSGGTLWIIANMGLSADIQSSLGALRLPPYLLLGTMAIGLIVLGTVVSPTLQMILVIPALTPVAIAQGIDVIQFGLVVVLASAIGLVTPPVGILLFLTSAQADTSVMSVVKESLPYLFALLLLLLCLILFPVLSTGLLALL